MCESGGGTGRAKSCLLAAVKGEAEAIVDERGRVQDVCVCLCVEDGNWRRQNEINKRGRINKRGVGVWQSAAHETWEVRRWVGRACFGHYVSLFTASPERH